MCMSPGTFAKVDPLGNAINTGVRDIGVPTWLSPFPLVGKEHKDVADAPPPAVTTAAAKPKAVAGAGADDQSTQGLLTQ